MTLFRHARLANIALVLVGRIIFSFGFSCSIWSNSARSDATCQNANDKYELITDLDHQNECSEILDVPAASDDCLMEHLHPLQSGTHSCATLRDVRKRPALPWQIGSAHEVCRRYQPRAINKGHTDLSSRCDSNTVSACSDSKLNFSSEACWSIRKRSSSASALSEGG